MFSHRPDPNPYAAPQTVELPSTSPVAARVPRAKQPKPPLLTGPELCLMAVCIMLVSVGVIIAGLFLRIGFLLALPLGSITVAVVCHFRGLVHLLRVDVDKGARLLFAISLISFALAMMLVFRFYYMTLILREQTPRAYGIVQKVFWFSSYISLLWGLIRLGVAQNQHAVVWCTSISLIIKFGCTSAVTLLNGFPDTNFHLAQVWPQQLGQTSRYVGIAVAVASLVGLFAYMLALWFIRKSGTQVAWRKNMLIQLHGMQELAKQTPDERAT